MMPTIEVDATVYAYLKSKIVDFGDTPNSVLIRELGIAPKERTAAAQLAEREQIVSEREVQRRAPKTRMSELIKSGVLEEGQPLRFRDPRGKQVPGGEGAVSGDSLVYKKQTRSLSDVTAELMQSLGNSSDSYRGPEYWYTARGKSIRELWDAHLRRTAS